jgi:hypothetical protein
MRWISFFLFVFAATCASAQNIEYLHVNSATNSKWQDAVGNFLNMIRPEVTDIHCMLSGGKDFHLWAKAGNSTNKYSMSLIATNSVTNWQKEVSTLVESGSGLPCAFNAQSQIWIIKAE